MIPADKSRVPLPINAAMDRMNLPTPSGEWMPFASAAVPGHLIEDYQPLSKCLEWRMAQVHWDQTGLLSFTENTIPFLINNNGRLSADLSRVFYAHCSEAEHLPGKIGILELGAGTGLFARYFLDCFRDICGSENKDFYDRLTYIVTDRSHRTVEQWNERGLFAAHGVHAHTMAFDPMAQPSFDFNLRGELRAVICNYVLDVLPAAVVRKSAQGPEELCVQTYLTGDANRIQQYTTRTPAQIGDMVAASTAGDLLELSSLAPLLEFSAAFRPWQLDVPQFAAEVLEFAAASKTLVNVGALQTLERLIGAMEAEGFVLINDYGPVEIDQVEQYCTLQRFGPSVAYGINFPLLDSFCAMRGILVTKPGAGEQRGIHTRLLSRHALTRTRAVALEAFSGEARAHYETCVQQARENVAAGRLQEALVAYREAVMRDPRNWHLLGEAAEFLSLQLRSFDAAVELLREAVALNPCFSSWLWNALGDSLYCLQRYEDAHEAYLQASRIEPNDSRTSLNLGYTLAHFGLLEDALHALARGLAHDTLAVYRTRLLEKQSQILAQFSDRWRAEQDSLAQRASRLHHT